MHLDIQILHLLLTIATVRAAGIHARKLKPRQLLFLSEPFSMFPCLLTIVESIHSSMLLKPWLSKTSWHDCAAYAGGGHQHGSSDKKCKCIHFRSTSPLGKHNLQRVSACLGVPGTPHYQWAYLVARSGPSQSKHCNFGAALAEAGNRTNTHHAGWMVTRLK